MGNVLKKRLSSPGQNREEDLLDHLIKDMNTDKFLNEDFIVQLMFGLLFVTSDSISTTLALAFKLLAEHPSVLEELIVSISVNFISYFLGYPNLCRNSLI